MTDMIMEGDSAIIVPGAEIVATSLEEVKGRLLEALALKPAVVTVEMGQTRMIDSMGIALLIAANNSLAAINGRLKLVNVGADIYSLMKMMRLDQHMDISAA